MPAKSKDAMLTFKGRPLRRKDNKIYYGSMSEKYIILLEIIESKSFEDLNLATKVSLQLQYTDPELKSRDKVIRSSEKSSFYEAIDVAAVWLERALKTG